MNSNHRTILTEIAKKAMAERGFNADFPESVLQEVEEIGASGFKQNSHKDLRNLLWCAIDNEDSRDIDQLSYAERVSDNMVRVYVAVADVDALVRAWSGIDNHASQNTTSIYTTAKVFHLLPEKLSTNLTSLNFDSERPAMVIEMVVDEEGDVKESDVYTALVVNYAQLDYDSVSAWLDETAPMPAEIARVAGLAENIRLQELTSQHLRKKRYQHGALDFDTIEARPVFEGDTLHTMKVNKKNRAKNMIEDFMITCNSITAQFLAAKNFPSLRRVVPKPKRWDRIVELASEHGYTLSSEPDPKSLSDCLKSIKQNEPKHYTDFSFSVLKLMGGGDYRLEMPGAVPLGHFGLAVKNYSHSTAPNRRYPDLITHRLLKAAINGEKIPYTIEELEQIAKNCTVKEDNAKKVERQVEKSAHALLMESRIGEVFDAMVSGAAAKGTWIRLLNPHLEGKLVKGFEGLEVGQRLKARLVEVNLESGFIDFEKVE